MVQRLSRRIRTALAVLILVGMTMPVAGQSQQRHFVVKDERHRFVTIVAREH